MASSLSAMPLTAGRNAEVAIRRLATLPGRLAAWVWQQHPLATAAMVLAIDFGMLFAIRTWEHGSFYVPWSDKTFVFGDSVFLPGYIGFGALALRGLPRPLRLSDRRWNVLVFAASLLCVVLLDAMSVATGHQSVLHGFRPSKVYHALILPGLFCLLAGFLPHVWRRRASRSAMLALACLGIYLAISLVELHSNVTTSVEIASSYVRSVFAA